MTSTPSTEGQIADRRGIPICAGDVVRSKHFRFRRRMMYLYHVVVERDGALELVPAQDLARKHDGGSCWLKSTVRDGLSFVEIVQGCGPENLLFIERKRARTNP